jgi:hypothetical protein
MVDALKVCLATHKAKFSEKNVNCSGLAINLLVPGIGYKRKKSEIIFKINFQK